MRLGPAAAGMICSRRSAHPEEEEAGSRYRLGKEHLSATVACHAHWSWLYCVQ